MIMDWDIVSKMELHILIPLLAWEFLKAEPKQIIIAFVCFFLH